MRMHSGARLRVFFVSAGLLLSLAPVRAGATSIAPPEQTGSGECLSCHESGTAPAVDRYRAHAVGIDYATARRSSPDRLRPANAQSGLGATVADDLLVAGRIECTTCHLSHQEGSGMRYRLRTGEDATQLCRGCHKLD